MNTNFDLTNPGIIGVLTSLLLILIAWRLTPKIGRGARQKRMDRLLDGEAAVEGGPGTVAGSLSPLARLAARYLPGGIIKETRVELYWAHRNGKLLSFDPETYTAIRVLAAVGAFFYGWVVAGGVFSAVLFGGGAFWLVAVYLSSQAGGARKQFRRALPMAVATLDMLRAGGASLDEAIRILVREGGDIVSRWMAEVVAAAKGEKPTEALVAAAKETNLPSLIRVCTTLDDVERRGVGLERLAEAAKEMVADYRRELKADASKLGVTSVFVIIAFDMIPFIALVVGPWALAAFRMIG